MTDRNCMRDMNDTCTDSGKPTWPESDARGIYLCRVCEDCEKEKLAGYRFDVLTNSQYEADEAIEPEGY